jgi:hypothetical protein
MTKNEAKPSTKYARNRFWLIGRNPNEKEMKKRGKTQTNKQTKSSAQ